MGDDAVKSHLLHFPCRGAVFDWFGEMSGSGVPRVTVDLLAEQREFERVSANRAKRITCHGCGNSEARYVVCSIAGKTSNKLYPRRFPKSYQHHKPGCLSYSDELNRTEPDSRPAGVRASGDFSSLHHLLMDPEFSV